MLGNIQPGGWDHKRLSIAWPACSRPRQLEHTSCGSLAEIRFPQQITRGPGFELLLEWGALSSIIEGHVSTCSPAQTVKRESTNADQAVGSKESKKEALIE